MAASALPRSHVRIAPCGIKSTSRLSHLRSILDQAEIRQSAAGRLKRDNTARWLKQSQDDPVSPRNTPRWLSGHSRFYRLPLKTARSQSFRRDSARKMRSRNGSCAVGREDARSDGELRSCTGRPLKCCSGAEVGARALKQCRGRGGLAPERVIPDAALARSRRRDRDLPAALTIVHFPEAYRLRCVVRILRRIGQLIQG
jgi:hypothetical protein